jgi:hypothetical protein
MTGKANLKSQGYEQTLFHTAPITKILYVVAGIKRTSNSI